MTEIKLTETLIQNHLFPWCERNKHRWIIPNFQAFMTGEMDLCSVLKSGLVNEFEIKISKADFKADAKKGKHEIFRKLLQGIKSEKQILWRQEYERVFTSPNYFYYVVPLDLITVNDIPDYAGLVYVNPRNLYNIFIMKKPKRIHKEPISDEKKFKIGQSLMYRFWQMRRK